MRAGRLDVTSLITDRIPMADAETAYGKIMSDPAALGVILEYQDAISADWITVMLMVSQLPS